MSATPPTTQRPRQIASRAAAFRAAIAGRQAHRDGRDRTVCPHNASGSPAEAALARYWLRGWDRAEAARHP